MMKPSKSSMATIAFCVVGLLPSSPMAEKQADPSQQAGNDTSTTVQPRLADLSKVVYIPPAPDNPIPGIRIGLAGTRAGSDAAPTVSLLVPEHVAFTVSEQPTLYWHLSEDTRRSVVVTLSADDADDPLLELALKQPVASGVHALRLTDHGVRLEPDKRYEWSVTVTDEGQHSSGDVIGRSLIQRAAPSPNLQTMIAGSPDPVARATVYARNAIWYDAFNELGENIAREPANRSLREMQAALLQQVGLGSLSLAKTAALSVD